MSPKALRLALLDSPTYGRLRWIPDGALVLEKDRIVSAGAWSEVTHHSSYAALPWESLPGCVATPGLVDAHLHLPQYPAVASPETSLLPWLQRHIFPLEKNFKGKSVEDRCRDFFEALMAQGTTLAGVYLAVFEESARIAFSVGEASGLRLVMGKVMMDRGSYGDLQAAGADPAQSLAETRRLIGEWHGKASGRLSYAVSPRFALSCSAELMRKAADLAQESGAFIQTHLAESPGEVSEVARLFPEARDYTDVYDQCGLLTPKTLLGHCIYLSEREVEILAERNCVIAHCPTSNLFLKSGIMPYDRLKAAGLRMALASDVAAGPELNLWKVARSALESQQARSFHFPDVEVPGIAELFFDLTSGGASAFGRGHELGKLEAGFKADLAIWDLASLRPAGSEDPVAGTGLDAAALLMYLGGPGALRQLFVDGRCLVNRQDSSSPAP